MSDQALVPIVRDSGCAVPNLIFNLSGSFMHLCSIRMVILPSGMGARVYPRGSAPTAHVLGAAPPRTDAVVISHLV